MQTEIKMTKKSITTIKALEKDIKREKCMCVCVEHIAIQNKQFCLVFMNFIFDKSNYFCR